MKLFAAIVVLPLFCGCSSIKHAQNCSHICERYQQCVDTSVDNRTCTKTCRAKGEADDAFAKKTETCKACLDGRSCISAAACALKCVAVILKSTEAVETR